MFTFYSYSLSGLNRISLIHYEKKEKTGKLSLYIAVNIITQPPQLADKYNHQNKEKKNKEKIDNKRNQWMVKLVNLVIPSTTCYTPCCF